MLSTHTNNPVIITLELHWHSHSKTENTVTLPQKKKILAGSDRKIISPGRWTGNRLIFMDSLIWAQGVEGGYLLG